VISHNLDKVRRLADTSDHITVEVGIYHAGSFSHRGRGEDFEFRISNLASPSYIPFPEPPVGVALFRRALSRGLQVARHPPGTGDLTVVVT
jgi:hypothetical protein